MNYYEYNGHEPGPTAVSFGGMGFVSMLQIAFIVLKLCGVITWSWWFVMMPYLASFGLMVLAALIFGAVCWVLAVKDTRYKRKLLQEREAQQMIFTDKGEQK